jgi:hypothetical protein
MNVTERRDRTPLPPLLRIFANVGHAAFGGFKNPPSHQNLAPALTAGAFFNDASPLPAALVCRGIGCVASAENGQVTLLRQASGIDSKRMMPMTLIPVMVFNTLVALALGFLFGRIYQIRRDELERRDGFALPPTARIPQP